MLALLLTHILVSWSLLAVSPELSPEPNPDRSSRTQIDAEPTMVITRGIEYIERPGTLAHFTSLDIYQPNRASSTPRPILIYVHGGGWAFGDKAQVHAKPGWAFENDWILVSVNYRLSPQVMHPEHAQDVAAAIAYVHTHTKELGGDPDRIVLIGHSAGAHLVGIVSSDEDLLAEYGLAPSDISATVLLDGAGYNIPQQMKSPLLKGKIREMFENAFGTDPELWMQASPTLQAMVGDQLPSLMGVHVPRLRSTIETKELVKVWNATGAAAIRHLAPNKDHASLNRTMGNKNDPDTRAVESFIRSVFNQD